MPFIVLVVICWIFSRFILISDWPILSVSSYRSPVSSIVSLVRLYACAFSFFFKQAIFNCSIFSFISFSSSLLRAYSSRLGISLLTYFDWTSLTCLTLCISKVMLSRLRGNFFTKICVAIRFSNSPCVSFCSLMSILVRQASSFK